MRNWCRALETAFEASLKKRGYIGNFGNERTSAKPCGLSVTRTDDPRARNGNKRGSELGDRQFAQKQQIRTCVTEVTSVTSAFDEYEERAALVEYGAGVPREWAEGFAKLDLSNPASGFSIAQWRVIIEDGARFLDRWANEAVSLGWYAADVFGVHPAAPSARFDAMGLVPIIGGGEVTAITDRNATIRSPGGQVVVYLRRPLGEGVCLWDLAAGPPQCPENGVPSKGEGGE